MEMTILPMEVKQLLPQLKVFISHYTSMEVVESMEPGESYRQLPPDVVMEVSVGGSWWKLPLPPIVEVSTYFHGSQ